MSGIETPKQRSQATVVRPSSVADLVVFAGGVPACGKSLLTAVLGSFERVEIQKYNYILEHIGSLHFIGRIDDDVALAMTRMLSDLDLYNMMMTREVNLRWQDCSSIFKNPKPMRYISRLFTPGNAEAVERIRTERPIAHILVHYLMMFSGTLAKALGDRCRMIEVVRHPLYMIKQWYLYNDHFGNDPRDFTIWIEHKGRSLPFFALGWEEKYLSSTKMDRTIYSMVHTIEMSRKAYQALTPQQKNMVLTVPFERFVLEPRPLIRQIEDLLSTRATEDTERELRKQNVPRKMYADGIALPIYKQYGWQRPEEGSTERSELEKRRAFAAKEASPAAMKVLDEACARYEEEHMKGLPH